MDAPTFVLARSPLRATAPMDTQAAQPAERRALEDRLAEALAAHGHSVLLVPHVYYLTHSHPATSRLIYCPGDIVLASWLHPRAALWTLRALGVEGQPPPAAGEGEEAAATTRSLQCLNPDAFESAETCLDALRKLGGPCEGTAPQGGRVEDLSEDLPPRWYPVLDYSLCQGCQKCFDFCLFGVYAIEDEQVVAAAPDRCKPGCPACARLCPQGAIMFPHYSSDPAIAGAPGTRVSIDARLAALVRKQCEESVAASEAAGSCACRREGGDDLDDLIDALEELDD